MEEQLNIFDYAESLNRREMAIAQVDQNAEPEWKDVALKALYEVALTRRTFIVDEIWKEMPDDITTGENRAMGAVVRRGLGRGWIEGTEQYAPSRKVTSHGVPRQVWRSLIYEYSHAEES